jgi:uncharacterized membrane protein YdjX (TVP38/TMEM64 family)
LEEYFILFALVLAANLMPAFGPPTWSIIVIFGFNTNLPVAGTVIVGALAAASGRFLLACMFRLLGDRVPDRIQRNLAAARLAFERRRGAGVIALGLFALSPAPSAQLFEAAGLAKVKLLAFTAAFFSGRLVSYWIYAAGARTLRSRTLGEAFTEQLASPVGVAVQFLMIGGLVALTMIDWGRVGDAGKVGEPERTIRKPLRTFPNDPPA